VSSPASTGVGGRASLCLITAVVLGILGIARAAEAVTYVLHTSPPTAGAEVVVDGWALSRTDENGKAVIDTQPGEHSLRVVKNGQWIFDQTLQFDEVINLIEVEVEVVKTPTRRPQRELPSGAPPQRAEGPREGLNIGLVLVLVALILAAGVVGIVVLRGRTAREPLSAKAPKVLAKPHRTDFDRYRIDKTIGSGGVATVFRALDPTEGAVVALKVLDQKWMHDAEMVRKFLGEADALRSVRQIDPSAPVVDVYVSGREGGRPDGIPFIALQLLDGEDLEARIKSRSGLPEREAVGIAMQIANALVAMKEAGVVHRDLTPDNVFLIDGEGVVGGRTLPRVPRVVLIDFGVARQEFLARATMDGSIAGKPPFMSPEQCRGEKVDFRTDLYALGLVIYTMLNRTPPFTGKNPFEVMKAQEEADVPPLGDDVSAAVRDLVSSLLEKDPGQRPSSPLEVLDRLKEIFE